MKKVVNSFRGKRKGLELIEILGAAAVILAICGKLFPEQMGNFLSSIFTALTNYGITNILS